MSDVETAWLAGLLEGEGCFSIGRSAQVILQMTDEDVVRRAAALMGADRVTVTHSERYRPLYSAKVYAAKAEAVMRAILPFMGERRAAKITEALAFRDAQMMPTREAACKYCGTQFERARGGRGRGAVRLYCSNQCKNSNRNERRKVAA